MKALNASPNAAILCLCAEDDEAKPLRKDYVWEQKGKLTLSMFLKPQAGRLRQIR